MNKFARAVTFSLLFIVGVSATLHAQKSSKQAIEIRQDKRKKFRFFYLGSDGKTLAMCVRGYATEADATRDIAAVKAALGSKSSSKSGVSISMDKRKKYRFKVVGTGGKTLVIGIKGYEKKADAEKAVTELKAVAPLKPTKKK